MKFEKLEDKLDRDIQDGIDLNNCGKFTFIDDNDEYYLLIFELSSGEKISTDIWKDEMSATELFDKFLQLSEQCTRYMK